MPAIEPTEVGDERLDHEDTTISQLRRHVTETAELILLREQREESVEGDEDEREAAVDLHVGKVADRHRHGVAVGLLSELRHHRAGRIDTVHVETPANQRQRDAPGADPQLQNATAAGELDQARDGWLRVDRRIPRVVKLGHPISIGVTLVSRHGAGPPFRSRSN